MTMYLFGLYLRFLCYIHSLMQIYIIIYKLTYFSCYHSFVWACSAVFVFFYFIKISEVA